MPAGAQTATRLADIEPGSGGSYPFNLTRSGSFVYFSASDSVEGRRLWKTDGTPAGTVPLYDPRPIPNDNHNAQVNALVDVDGTLFFSPYDGSTPSTLWKTDGTVAGTVHVSDVAPGILADSTATAGISWNGELYFIHYDPAYGHQLWRSDGTEAGTVKIKDLSSARPTNLSVLAGRLYFIMSSSELWTSDGTEAGTYKVMNLVTVNPGATCPPPPFVFYPEYWCLQYPTVYHLLAEAGGLVYVAALENVGTTFRVALWTTDGTVAGSHRVREASTHVFDMVAYDDTLYLTVEDPATGAELWTSDGTAAGTVLVDDIVPGSGSSWPHHFFVVNGTLWFVTSTSAPFELWTSDGTQGGSEPVGAMFSDVSGQTAVGSKLSFDANDACGDYELWISDGASSGIRRPRQFVSYNFTAVTPDGKLLYVGDNGGGVEIWSYDGGTPPPDSCGDGIVDSGEGCDLGDGNGQSSSCCQCTCTLSDAGTECAASTGGCDLPEVCDGTSAVCPAPVASACGNGILESGEQCDEGTANGEEASCCGCDCTAFDSATLCRASSHASSPTCDPPEYCTGTTGGCPADVYEDDGDFDGVCDSTDPCVRFDSGWRRAKLSLDNVQSRGKLTVEMSVPEPPAIDPPANGVRLLIENEDHSESIVDVTIPPGGYDPASNTGWKPSPTGTSWTYVNHEGYDGITRFTVKMRDKAWNMVVKISMSGRSFEDSGMTVPHPLNVTLVIDSPSSTSGQCAWIHYLDYQCEADQTEQIVRCE
ncbi:MAG TPA: ELWxxDGT repeat protein [Candidatus Limnocylindrales bacterium]|nr:ELWxxDGT repeat protein [Candidatus Limnocylindrales bacterium]